MVDEPEDWYLYPRLEIARMERRIATLEARLARVLRLAEESGLTMHWTEHNGGGVVWSWRSQRHGTRGKAGRVWSRRRASRGGKGERW